MNFTVQKMFDIRKLLFIPLKKIACNYNYKN
jgi:hypothetical protein